MTRIEEAKAVIEARYARIIRLKQAKIMNYSVEFSGIPQNLIGAFLDLNGLFTELIDTYRPDLIKYLPYKVEVKELVAKNKWTSGTYVAINNPDGTLSLHLNYDKLSDPELYPKFPTEALLWVLMHEFRHKVQLNEPALLSMLEFPNWKNFNEFMQKAYNKDEDFINHIFHELNPAEVDANMFACEMTGVKFNGNAFNIDAESIALLSETKHLTTEELIKKWIDDMCKHGFMHGWGGDKSQEFKDRQCACMMDVINGNIDAIGGNYRLLATIQSDYMNLKQYCGWTDDQLKSLLNLFGFETIREVYAVMACDSEKIKSFMENAKLKKGVRFELIPTLE